MNYRNAKFNMHGTIDVEIEHPKYGWIPFTADPNDPVEYGRQIHAEVVKGNVQPYTGRPKEEIMQERMDAINNRVDPVKALEDRIKKLEDEIKKNAIAPNPERE